MMKNTFLFLLLFSVMSCNTNSNNQKQFKNYAHELSDDQVEALYPLIDSTSLTSLTSIYGDTLTLGKSSNKPTILVFFATWCPACKVALPELSRYYGNSQEVNLIVVGREHTQDELINWDTKTAAYYDLVADENRSIYAQFAQESIPRIYLIDQRGKVRYQDVGWGAYMIDELNKRLTNF